MSCRLGCRHAAGGVLWYPSGGRRQQTPTSPGGRTLRQGRRAQCAPRRACSRCQMSGNVSTRRARRWLVRPPRAFEEHQWPFAPCRQPRLACRMQWSQAAALTGCLRLDDRRLPFVRVSPLLRSGRLELVLTAHGTPVCYSSNPWWVVDGRVRGGGRPSGRQAYSTLGATPRGLDWITLHMRKFVETRHGKWRMCWLLKRRAVESAHRTNPPPRREC